MPSVVAHIDVVYHHLFAHLFLRHIMLSNMRVHLFHFVDNLRTVNGYLVQQILPTIEPVLRCRCFICRLVTAGQLQPNTIGKYQYVVANALVEHANAINSTIAIKCTEPVCHCAFDVVDVVVLVCIGCVSYDELFESTENTYIANKYISAMSDVECVEHVAASDWDVM